MTKNKKKLLRACWHSRPCTCSFTPPPPSPLPPWFIPLVHDWLGQGQVTRAQEAEENYLVKRELATVKQQSEEASAQLEQAQSAIKQLQQQQQQPAVRKDHTAPPPGQGDCSEPVHRE